MKSTYEGILDMLTFFLSLLFGSSLAAVDSFYPPLNHTTYITNASLGTYGGVFSAPGNAASRTDKDVYNYCTMPHPQIDTYALPRPVGNGSVNAKLVYLNYVQRHQRRTPYNILPGGENQEYHCDDIHPHLFASPASGNPSPVQVYGQGYTDPTNPFLKNYVNGTCQYPQLTIGGFLDGYQHGRDLYAIYGEKLGLIPETLDSKKVWLRSSTSALTQGSAGGVLRGLWPEYKGPLPLHQQAESIDTINRGFPCAARDTFLSKIQSSAEWNEHITVTSSLRNTLVQMFDGDESAWTDTWDHFADNFQARLCNGYDLPCSVSKSSQCVSEDQANEVFRAGDWMYNYWYRKSADAKGYIQTTEGLFIAELVRAFRAVVAKDSEIVYSHTFFHDGDIAPLLGALGIRVLRWPGMASNVAFEIWETENKEFYARVLYSGRTIETVHGVLEWIPISKLIDILSPFIPEDIFSLCG
ncbi:histidine phosphatase superfamily [Aspergillus unguis]